MIHVRTNEERMRDLVDRLAQRERERNTAEAEARYWREAYFDHMRDEHPEIVERVMRRYAEEKA